MTSTAAEVKTKANEKNPGTALDAKCRFHNPCPPGQAANERMTRTECLGLPVPAEGPRYASGK